jgi:hypothetical protein
VRACSYGACAGANGESGWCAGRQASPEPDSAPHVAQQARRARAARRAPLRHRQKAGHLQRWGPARRVVGKYGRRGGGRAVSPTRAREDAPRADGAVTAGGDSVLSACGCCSSAGVTGRSTDDCRQREQNLPHPRNPNFRKRA